MAHNTQSRIVDAPLEHHAGVLGIGAALQSSMTASFSGELASAV
jgi:hypothetical protein